MNQKVLRIVLCVLCAVAFVALLFAPVVNYSGLSMSLYDALFSPASVTGLLGYIGVTATTGNTLYYVLAISALVLLVACIIFALLKVTKNAPGALGMLAGYFTMAAAFASQSGNILVFGDTTGWGVYVTIALGAAIFVIGFLLLLMKEGVTVTNNNANKGPVKSPDPVNAAYIVGIGGAYNNAKFDVTDGSRILFGRDASTCHVIFDQFETAVSRQHCAVTYNKVTGMYAVMDMSKNGTYVNTMNNRLPSNVETLQPRGTVILIGSSKNAFRLS